MEPYITFVNGIMMEVRCKGACDALLLQRRGPAQNLRVDKTNDYGELVLAMQDPDGMRSKHETAMCRACRLRLRMNGARPGELDDIYAQDVAMWITEAVVVGRIAIEEAEALADRFAQRIVLGVVDEPGRGETYLG